MPTQEVAPHASLAMLLRAAPRRPHAVALDGGGPHGWIDGHALYADTPCATLTVDPSGWGRWREHGTHRWEWGPPLDQWQRFLDRAPAMLGPHADPRGGGVLTVLAFDLKHWIERLGRRHLWPTEPLLFCALYDWTYTRDDANHRAWLSATSERVLRARVRRCARPPRIRHRRGPSWSTPRPTIDRDAYRRMVERALRYIAAGDIYQVNLAQRFDAPGRGDPTELFAALTAQSPMPFAAYVDGGDWVAVSNSPECLLAIDGHTVATFPIKGTRRADAGGLALDPKERAEHIMIVDLERNDLGRVCEPGSVAVRECAAVHRFPVLQHLVSGIDGRLRPRTTPADIMRAVFPGGSITGAPKVRALQIIEELEPAPRGLYTGSIGWTTLDGRSRFNIAIRTGVATRTGLRYFAGGGIVADSDPDREYEETLLKSEAFFAALAGLAQPSTATRHAR